MPVLFRTVRVAPKGAPIDAKEASAADTQTEVHTTWFSNLLALIAVVVTVANAYTSYYEKSHAVETEKAKISLDREKAANQIALDRDKAANQLTLDRQKARAEIMKSVLNIKSKAHREAVGRAIDEGFDPPTKPSDAATKYPKWPVQSR